MKKRLFFNWVLRIFCFICESKNLLPREMIVELRSFGVRASTQIIQIACKNWLRSTSSKMLATLIVEIHDAIYFILRRNQRKTRQFCKTGTNFRCVENRWLSEILRFKWIFVHLSLCTNRTYSKFIAKFGIESFREAFTATLWWNFTFFFVSGFPFDTKLSMYTSLIIEERYLQQDHIEAETFTQNFSAKSNVVAFRK